MIYQTLFRFRFMILLLPAALVLLSTLFLGGPQTAAAQDTGPAASLETAAITTTIATTVTANDINAVARELWCPLCSGVRLDACELKACAQMKDMIGVQLAEGQDVQSIKNYFIAQYGPQVLGEPPLEGFNWLAWILPVVALAAGGLFVFSRVRHSTRAAQSADAEPPTQPAGDTYSRKLDEELKHYD